MDAESKIIKFEDVQNSIIQIKDTKVILDADVARLYEVETKRVNEAVKNNPDKFPDGYIIEVSLEEAQRLRSKNPTLKSGRGQHSKYPPKAFTEKGLYMLATILKSPTATQTTLAIIEAFAKVRELARTIGEMSANPDKFRQKSLMEKSGEIIGDLFGDEMRTTDTETEIELNFAVLKIKHTIKRKK